MSEPLKTTLPRQEIIQVQDPLVGLIQVFPDQTWHCDHEFSDSHKLKDHVAIINKIVGETIYFGTLAPPRISLIYNKYECCLSLSLDFSSTGGSLSFCDGSIISLDNIESRVSNFTHTFGIQDGERIHALYSEIFELEFVHVNELISSFYNRFLPEIFVKKPFLIGAPFETWQLEIETYDHQYINPYREKITQFSTQYKQINRSIDLKINRIAILTTKIKGGHESVARSLEKEFCKKGFEVLILYTDRHVIDPLKNCGISYKGEPIDCEAVRNRLLIGGEDLLASRVLQGVEAHISKFFPGSIWQYNAMRIKEFAPAHIFSSCHHRVDDHLKYSQLLGLPLNVVLPDYYISARIKNLLSCDLNIYSQSLDILVQNTDKRYGHKEPILGNTYGISLDKIKLIGNSADELFFRSLSIEQTAEIREKYDLLKDEKVILVTFGSSPDKEIVISAYNELLKCALSEIIPTYKIIVVCGESRELYEFLSGVENSSLITLPKISTKDMADLFLIADCLIGKPGGAVTSQVEASNLFFIGFAMYEWEIANMIYLKKQGRGAVVDIRWDSIFEFEKTLLHAFEETSRLRADPAAKILSISDLIDEIID